MKKLLAHSSVALCVCLSSFSIAARAEDGVTPTSVRIGQSTYLTGVMAELGNDFKRGAEMYFADVNQAGGVFGRKIILTSKDDAYDPKKALANAEEFQREGTFALFQFAGTGSVQTVSAYAASAKIPLVAAIATGPKLRGVLNPYTFYVRPGNTEEYEAIVKNLSTIGVKRVGVAYIDEAYGEEGLDAIKKISAHYNMEIAVAASLKKNGDGAAAAAKAISEKQPSAVILVTLPMSTKAFILAYGKGRAITQIYTPSAGLPNGMIKELGGAAAGVGITRGMPNENNDTIPVVHDYRAAAKKAGQATFSGPQLEGYLDAKIFVEALRRAGKNPTRAGLVSALDSMSNYNAGGFAVQFSKTNHAASSAIDLVVVNKYGKIIY